MSRATQERAYVVRFGPWARNLYLGLPAAFTFALVSVAAEMPLWLAIPWNGVVALMVWICAFPREVRIYPDGRVRVVRRFLAIVPVWSRSYPRSAFTAVKQYGASYSMPGEATIEVATVYLIPRSGKPLPIQSYSAGADNQPPPQQLGRDLTRLLGLPFES